MRVTLGHFTSWGSDGRSVSPRPSPPPQGKGRANLHLWWLQGQAAGPRLLRRAWAEEKRAVFILSTLSLFSILCLRERGRMVPGPPEEKAGGGRE